MGILMPILMVLAILGVLVAILEILMAIFGVLMAMLGSWGLSWEGMPFRVPPLGPLLGPSRGPPSWAVLGASWAVLGRSWVLFWAVLDGRPQRQIC